MSVPRSNPSLLSKNAILPILLWLCSTALSLRVPFFPSTILAARHSRFIVTTAAIPDDSNHSARRRNTASSTKTTRTSLHSSSDMSSPSETYATETERTACIKNFRAADGLDPYIFRCASTDDLAMYANNDDQLQPIAPSDRLVYEQAGLILDLRSESERDGEKAQQWTQSAPNGPVSIIPPKDYSSGAIIADSKSAALSDRSVVLIDVLSPQRFMNYVTERWLTSPKEQLQAKWYKLVDTSELHAMRIEKLNERGLFGLNEVILETGKTELLDALITITLYLEKQQRDEQNGVCPVVIHCVKGKDRTGMLTMLLQSVRNIPDDRIIADYAKSNEAFANEVKPTAAMAGQERSGRLDKAKFAGSNPQAMIDTLEFLKSKYGSAIGYLNDIGFHATWRERLISALSPTSRSKL